LLNNGDTVMKWIINILFVMSIICPSYLHSVKTYRLSPSNGFNYTALKPTLVSRGYSGALAPSTQNTHFFYFVDLNYGSIEDDFVKQALQHADNSYVFIIEKVDKPYGHRSSEELVLEPKNKKKLVMWFYPNSQNQCKTIVEAVRQNFVDTKQAHVLLADISRELLHTHRISIDYENTFPTSPQTSKVDRDPEPVLPPPPLDVFKKYLNKTTTVVKKHPLESSLLGGVVLSGTIYLIASSGREKGTKLPPPPGHPNQSE